MKSTDCKKLFFVCCAAVLCSVVLNAQQEIVELTPEKKTDIAGTETELVIRADKQKAQVYINDQFMGLTPLTITKLIPGQYRLTVQSGAQKKTFQIETQRSMRLEFYIDTSLPPDQLKTN